MESKDEHYKLILDKFERIIKDNRNVSSGYPVIENAMMQVPNDVLLSMQDEGKIEIKKFFGGEDIALGKQGCLDILNKDREALDKYNKIKHDIEVKELYSKINYPEWFCRMVLL